MTRDSEFRPYFDVCESTQPPWWKFRARSRWRRMMENIAFAESDLGIARVPQFPWWWY